MPLQNSIVGELSNTYSGLGLTVEEGVRTMANASDEQLERMVEKYKSLQDAQAETAAAQIASSAFGSGGKVTAPGLNCYPFAPLFLRIY